MLEFNSSGFFVYVVVDVRINALQRLRSVVRGLHELRLRQFQIGRAAWGLGRSYFTHQWNRILFYLTWYVYYFWCSHLHPILCGARIARSAWRSITNSGNYGSNRSVPIIQLGAEFQVLHSGDLWFQWYFASKLLPFPKRIFLVVLAQAYPPDKNPI